MAKRKAKVTEIYPSDPKTSPRPHLRWFGFIHCDFESPCMETKKALTYSAHYNFLSLFLQPHRGTGVK